MLIRFIIWMGLAWAALAASAQAQLRPMVYAETTVDAPVQTVWNDWTTSEGLTSFFAEGADISREPGGSYAVYFAMDLPEGSRGSDAGIVLGMEPERMIHFTWAMPPYMPEIRPHMTAVQLRFDPVSDTRTRIRLYHTGFGDSPAWEAGEAYFEKTWPQVLASYKTHIHTNSQKVQCHEPECLKN